MSFIYVLIIYHFSYGFEFDHIEAFKTKKACIIRANHLPKGLYPDFDKTDIKCQKLELK